MQLKCINIQNQPISVILESAKRESGIQGNENGGRMVSYVYIMASQKNGTLYTGVTSDLIKRVYEHKEKLIKGFTSQYNVTQLVYFEVHSDITEAISREKRIKKWNRAWKLRLIEKTNPHWEDLYGTL